MPERPAATVHERRIRLALGALAGLLFGLLFLRNSELVGRLAAELQFDDNGYANDAAARLLEIGERGIAAGFERFWREPPHSPYSTLLAMLGFSVGGLGEFAMYAANLLPFTAMLAWLAWQCERARRGAFALCLAIVLLSPIAYRAIHEFRPDIVLGFLTAAMAWSFSAAWRAGTARGFVRAGLLFGAALLVKPSFFAHTVGIAGVLASVPALAVLARLAPGPTPSFAGAVRQGALFLATGALVAAPYYALNARHVFEYFWSNTRGGSAHLWSFDPSVSTLQVAWRFLADRDFTFRVLGYHLHLAVAIIVVGLVVLWLRRREAASDTPARVAVMLLCALASLTAMAVGRHMNEYFLSSFQWLLLMSALFVLVEVDRATAGWGRRALLLASAVGLALAVVANGRQSAPVNNRDAALAVAGNRAVVDLIRADREASGHDAEAVPRVLVPFAGGVSAESIRWTGYKLHWRIDAVDAAMVGELAAVRTQAAGFDYVVIANPERAEFARGLPSGQLQLALFEWLSADPAFQLVGPMSGERRQFVFRRRDRPAVGPVISGPGLVLSEGFEIEEGPYPQWSLPKVRWMTQPTARVCAFDAGRPLRSVRIRARADAPGELRVGGEAGGSFGTVPLAAGGFVEAKVEVPGGAEGRCLLFEARLKDPPVPTRLVLFTALALD